MASSDIDSRDMDARGADRVAILGSLEADGNGEVEVPPERERGAADIFGELEKPCSERRGFTLEPASG
jgi:hypothetical protein